MTTPALNLNSYAGLWIALARSQVSGVGNTAEEARLASLDSRPKDQPAVLYLPESNEMRLRLPPLFEEVRPLLVGARPGTPIWLVGGAVRDGLLGIETHDLDFAVPGDTLRLARTAADALGGAFYPLDEERGAGRVILRRDGVRIRLDFATLRAPDLEGDLRLRDFTFNALAVPLDDPRQLIDPLQGEADLRARRVRACGPTSLSDDPVRALRAVRLAAQFNLRFETETRLAVKREAAGLARVSAERIRDEFMRLLSGRRPAAAVRVLNQLGLLERVLPEMAAMKGVTQSPPHIFDVDAHTLAVLERLDNLLGVLQPKHDVDAASDLALGLASVRLGRWRERLADHLTETLSSDRPARGLLFLAALLHDSGKPATRTVEAGGAIHFYGHDKVGADLAQERAAALRLSVDETRRVRTIVEHHMRPLLLAKESSGPSRRAVHRFYRATGQAGVDIGLLALADTLGTWGPEFRQSEWVRLTEVVTELLKAHFDEHESIVQPTPLVDGNDLIAHLGLTEGPAIGRLLEAVREAQAAGEVTDREAALSLAVELVQREAEAGQN